jgi:hypothetical protein
VKPTTDSHASLSGCALSGSQRLRLAGQISAAASRPALPMVYRQTDVSGPWTPERTEKNSLDAWPQTPTSTAR